LVTNTLDIPVNQIVIQVNLVSSDGRSLAEQQTMTARVMLMPGDSSPYGALFNSIPDAMAGPVVSLVSTSTGDDGLFVMPTTNIISRVDDGVWYISGEVSVPAGKSTKDVSLVATIFDSQDRVTGFRRIPINASAPLVSGVAIPFSFDIASQGTQSVRVEVSGESSP
jgi:hypothetical protein